MLSALPRKREREGGGREQAELVALVLPLQSDREIPGSRQNLERKFNVPT